MINVGNDPGLRVIPDLDDELTHALGQVEELLLTLEAWERQDGARLPASRSATGALSALEDILVVIAPTQSRKFTI